MIHTGSPKVDNRRLEKELPGPMQHVDGRVRTRSEQPETLIHSALYGSGTE